MRVHSGDDPQSQVVNRSGARIKRFVMSRKMTSLAHLHRGVATFIQSRKKNRGKSIEDTLAAGLTDRYGVMDISEDNPYMYSGRMLGFNKFRLFVQTSFFKVTISFRLSLACTTTICFLFQGNGGHFVQYRALFITKRKTEQARKRSRTSEDYFMMKLPVSCIDNFKKALEMAMTANGMVTLPLDEQLGMMGKARMCTATEQALKVYTQELNKELYERQGEERMKEAQLAAAAAITAEGEENAGEVAAEEEAAAEKASAESMDDETASISAVAGSPEVDEMETIEGELDEEDAKKKKRKEDKKKPRYSPVSSDNEDATGNDEDAVRKKTEEAMAKLKKGKKLTREEASALAKVMDVDEWVLMMQEQQHKHKEKKSKEFVSSDSEGDAEMEEKQKKKEKKSKETVPSDDSDMDSEEVKRLLGGSMYNTIADGKKK